MRIALVAAVADNGVIGADGRLPWRLSDDLRRFKAITWGKPIVMGRKTYDSIGKPLPGRANIVVTRNAAWRADGVQMARSVDEALNKAGEIAGREGASEICVIGGGEIFEQTIGQALRIYLTRVESDAPGDARFPILIAGDWRKTADGTAEVCQRNDRFCRFFILDRIE